ncbi:hypothetical protein [Salmonella phage PhiSEP1]|nr:hypothetical protein [Salmonella phage PhiSEP1]
MITLACRMTSAAVIVGTTSATSGLTRGYRLQCSM